MSSGSRQLEAGGRVYDEEAEGEVVNALTTESASLALTWSSDTGKFNHKTQIHRKLCLISSTALNLLMAPPVLPSVWFGRRAAGNWADVSVTLCFYLPKVKVLHRSGHC